MTQLSNLLGNFAKVNARIKAARANTGTGSLGWWPEPGLYQTALVGLSFEPCDFEYKATASSKERVKRPGFKVQAKLQLLNYPGDGNPKVVNGSPFVLPWDTEGLPSSQGCNQAMRVQIAEERMKGMLCTCLGVEEVEDTGASLMAVQALIAEKDAANSVLALEVDFQYGKDKNGKPKPEAEYYRSLIAS